MGKLMGQLNRHIRKVSELEGVLRRAIQLSGTVASAFRKVKELLEDIGNLAQMIGKKIFDALSPLSAMGVCSIANSIESWLNDKIVSQLKLCMGPGCGEAPDIVSSGL